MWQVPVVQKIASGATVLRGMLIMFSGQTHADVCKMLLTELQLGPTSARHTISAPFAMCVLFERIAWKTWQR